jgi:molybdenum-dependent DNA-binding transcriptional regulator ModE
MAPRAAANRTGVSGRRIPRQWLAVEDAEGDDVVDDAEGRKQKKAPRLAPDGERFAESGSKLKRNIITKK